jgi:alcohol dehydrogenase class IV
LQIFWTLLCENYKANLLIEEIKKLNKKLNIPKLRDLNIPSDIFEKIAEEALEVSVPIENNPCPINKENIIEIYRNAY